MTERRETGVIGSAELLNWNVLRRFKYTVPHFFRSLNMGVNWSGDSHENPLIRFPVFANDSQCVAAVPLTGKGDVKTSHLQLKQAGQQLCVVDIGAVRRIEIIPWNAMDPQPPSLFEREPRQREIV